VPSDLELLAITDERGGGERGPASREDLARERELRAFKPENWSRDRRTENKVMDRHVPEIAPKLAGIRIAIETEMVNVTGLGSARSRHTDVVNGSRGKDSSPVGTESL